MSLPKQKLAFAGNFISQDAVQVSFDSMTNLDIPNATRPYVLTGTGAPTFTAPQGSLYLRLDGSSVSTRAYINTTGSTTWTAVTTAA